MTEKEEGICFIVDLLFSLKRTNQEDTMNASDKVYRELPETFTRMYVKRLMYEFGYTPASNQHIIEKLCISGKIKRIERGIYQKLKQ